MSSQSKLKYPFMDMASAMSADAERLTNVARRVIKSGIYIGGDEVSRFERELGLYLGAPYVVGVGSGMDALRLTLRAYLLTGRLKEGDEVIVAANTYIASVLAIMDAGLKPVLVDPDEYTMNLAGRNLNPYITPRTRAIMPVHLYGRVCWDEELAAIAESYDLLVIEDCAQAIGAVSTHKGINGTRNAGTLGHAAAFSFYPTKNLGALGDGGAVVTSDPEIASTVRALGNYGADGRYHNVYPGFNSRLDPLQAAFLSERLTDLDKENSARAARAAIYLDRISRPDLILPPSAPDRLSVWHQFVVRIPGGRRDLFRSALAAQGVGTDIHYPVPPHRQPACSRYVGHSSLPVTEMLAGEIVSLPIASHLSANDIAEIAGIINRLDLPL